MPVVNRPCEFLDVQVSAEDESRVRRCRFSVFLSSNQNERPSVKGGTDTGEFWTLSHFIIGKPPPQHVVDHIDNNVLNNRRENLRFATYRQNAQNRVPKPNKSGYLGVSVKGAKWSVRCHNLYLGMFTSAIDAARHYDSYVIREYGPHAKRNMPDEVPQEYVPISKKVKTTDLPIGVKQIRRSQRFMAYAGRRHLGTFDTAAKAATAYQTFINGEKQRLHDDLLSVPIDYDGNGRAVLPVRKGGVMMKYMKVDPEDWHDFLSGGLNLTPDGYVQTRKNGVTVLAHRHVLKAAPGSTVDHINRQRTDCRKENLRFVTPMENLRNRKRKGSA